MSPIAIIDMTEVNMEHPTAGRRRRHKSPPVLHAQLAIPVPRLEDQIDTENGPSDEDGERMQSVRDPNYCSFLFLHQADYHTRSHNGDHSGRFWGN